MRRIALNARFHTQLLSGVQRYALEISGRLDGRLEPVLPSGPLSGMRAHVWEQFALPLRTGGRLLWSPCTTGPLAVARQVCTFHDIIPLEHPEWYNPRFAAWYAWLLPRLARRVRHISTVSEFTRERVIERLGIPPERVTTIPNGADARFSPRPPEEVRETVEALGWPRHYFLTIGIDPRKNAANILEAWRRAAPRLPGEIHLVMAGAAGTFMVHGSGKPLPPPPPRTRVDGYIEDSRLPAVYSGALALVFPSLYEGFGLPVLEAMACGTPVITSNGTALPEVAGGAALLVDPNEPDAIAEAMAAIAGSESLRRTLCEKGLARVAHYSWDESAARMWQLLAREAEV